MTAPTWARRPLTSLGSSDDRRAVRQKRPRAGRVLLSPAKQRWGSRPPARPADAIGRAQGRHHLQCAGLPGRKAAANMASLRCAKRGHRTGDTCLSDAPKKRGLKVIAPCTRHDHHLSMGLQRENTTPGTNVFEGADFQRGWAWPRIFFRDLSPTTYASQNVYLYGPRRRPSGCATRHPRPNFESSGEFRSAAETPGPTSSGWSNCSFGPSSLFPSGSLACQCPRRQGDLLQGLTEQNHPAVIPQCHHPRSLRLHGQKMGQGFAGRG